MSCGKETIIKSFKSDKDGCSCEPTDGKPCQCQNDTSDITCCDCKCDGSKCKCGEKCTCMSTGAYSCICICKDEKGNNKTCSTIPKSPCKCEGSGNGKCKCATGQCTCINTGACTSQGGLQSSCNCRGKACDADCKCGNAKCVCENEGDSGVCARSDKGNPKTCGDTSCKAAPGTDSGKGRCLKSLKNCNCKSVNSCICICKIKQGTTICCDDCKCDETNTCDKLSCTCVPKEAGFKKVEAKTCVCFESANSCVCVCENKHGKLVSCGTCKCPDGNNCGKECTCVAKGSTSSVISCICVCKNEQGETVCCDDCKCDETNTCDKLSCTCIPKEAILKKAGAKSCVCFEITNSCVCVCKNKQGQLVSCGTCKCPDANNCGKECTCVAKGSTSSVKSCICVCKNKQGETICCDDCKCDETNTCDKLSCTCIPKVAGNIKVEAKTCICFESANSCVCEEGKLVNCGGCKCSDANTCDKECTCVAKGSTGSETPSTINDCDCKQSADSCICICKNKQGENTCCEDCKCDETNACDKKDCTCVLGSVSCVEGCACAPEGSNTCICKKSVA